MKTFITLTVIFLAMACTSGGSTGNQESPSQATTRNAPVGKGDLAPDFTLQDQNGHEVKLSEARGKSPVVLVFYRGYW